jgi:hypothetical protein
MNSYLLTRLFYGELEKSEEMQRHCTPHHQALFFRLIQIQNQVGWGVKNFDLPTENTMFYSCIGSYKTYKNCLIDLVQWNLITEISGARNQYQARKISLYTQKWTEFTAATIAEPVPVQDQPTAGATTAADTHACAAHCQSDDLCTTKACAVNKTDKPLNDETVKTLKLKILKNTGSAKASKQIKAEVAGKKFAANEDCLDDRMEEHASLAEKKKVAPKRKDLSAKLKDTSTLTSSEKDTSKRRDKPDLLFKDSPYADKALFLAALKESEYGKANLEYYYEIVKNWSESKQARKKDWIATVKNWMLRDFKEGKLVTHELSNHAQPTATNTAGKNGYTVLGDAVDKYFERKYGK